MIGIEVEAAIGKLLELACLGSFLLGRLAGRCLVCGVGRRTDEEIEERRRGSPAFRVLSLGFRLFSGRFGGGRLGRCGVQGKGVLLRSQLDHAAERSCRLVLGFLTDDSLKCFGLAIARVHLLPMAVFAQLHLHEGVLWPDGPEQVRSALKGRWGFCFPPFQRQRERLSNGGRRRGQKNRRRNRADYRSTSCFHACHPYQ